jgi:hypothetical protein
MFSHARIFPLSCMSVLAVTLPGSALVAAPQANALPYGCYWSGGAPLTGTIRCVPVDPSLLPPGTPENIFNRQALAYEQLENDPSVPRVPKMTVQPGA